MWLSNIVWFPPVSTGLIALLDDIAGLAKVAAASLDDVAAGAAKAGVKAAGIVIDDAAVTPRFVVGFAADRELPIVAKIALGSLRNKLLYLLPGALVLSLVAPWAITPLLMLGGGWLCYEGTEKIYDVLWPGRHHAPLAKTTASENPQALEDQKVRDAICTDLILSAEIMAITLATVSDTTFLSRAMILAAVGVALTILVYGCVALIVKADDFGLALARIERPVSGLFRRSAEPDGPNSPHRADRILRPVVRSLGRGFVLGMPFVLRVLERRGHGGDDLGRRRHHPARPGGFWADLARPSFECREGARVACFASRRGSGGWAAEAAFSGVFGLLIGIALISITLVLPGRFFNS